MPPKRKTTKAAAETDAPKTAKKTKTSKEPTEEEKPQSIEESPKRTRAKVITEAEEPPKKVLKPKPQKPAAKGKKTDKKEEPKSSEPRKPPKSRGKKEEPEEEETEDVPDSAKPPKKRKADDKKNVNNKKTKAESKEEPEEEAKEESGPSAALSEGEDDEEEQPEKPTRNRAARGGGEPKPAKAAKSTTKAEPKKLANASDTDWASIDFKCTKKSLNGNEANTHIISWNVAGLRAWLKKGGLEILKHAQPDILCLQETKCSVDKLPEEMKSIEKYHAYWCNGVKDGYAGVGILTRVMPIDITYGIGAEEHDSEGRCITAEYKNFYLVNVYVPNAGRKLVTLPKRLKWNEAFKKFVKKLDEKKPVVVCGDMNVSHKEIDLANPKSNKKNAGFTIDEREGLTDFLKDGYIDSFRELYPDKTGAYTFWTHMSNARARNIGWRLDYFLLSERLMKNVCDNVIFNKVLGSDHCPLSLYLEI